MGFAGRIADFNFGIYHGLSSLELPVSGGTCQIADLTLGYTTDKELFVVIPEEMKNIH